MADLTGSDGLAPPDRGPLDRVPLGLSGLDVTRIVFGGAPIGGLFAPVSDDAAQATLEAAWSAGIRAFDTAPHYGVGLSEHRLGSFLKGRPRDEFVLSTKVGRLLVPTAANVDGAEGFYDTPQLTRVRDYSRDGVFASVEASMERLGVDRIDVALVHDPDDYPRDALEGAFPALAELRAEGIVGAIGVGMNQARMLEWFVAHADVDCVLVAGRYSLLDQSSADALLPACRDRGVGVLVGGVFNSGILAAAQAAPATYDYQPAPAHIVARAAAIRAVCARYGLPLAAVALHFSLRHPAVTAAVVGARSPAEITEDVGYLSTSVPADLLGELASRGLIRAERAL